MTDEAAAGDDAAPLIEQARAAVERSDWEAAHALWRQALEAVRQAGGAPDARDLAQFSRAALLHADALAEAGSFDAAKAAVSEALTINPRSAAGHTRLARILSSEGRPDLAADHWREVIRLRRELGKPVDEGLNGQIAKDLVAHADRLRRDGAHRAASEILEEARAVLPDDNRVLLGLAEVAADLQDDETAARYLDVLVTRPDLDAAASRRLMLLHCRLGRFAEAEDVLTSALLRAPRDASLRRARADFSQLRATGRPIWGKPLVSGGAEDRRIRSWGDARAAAAGPRILFAGDTLYRTNLGCRATTSALRRLIAVAGARIDFTMDVAQWGAYFAYSRAADRPTTADDLERIADVARKNPEFPASRALRACDAVIINGEGAFLEFNNAGRLLLSLAYMAKTAFAKPCFLVNHTCDLTNPDLQALAEAVYPLLDDVAFREPVSLERSGYIRAAHGLPQRFAADAIHSLEPSSPSVWAALAERGGQYSYHPFVEQPFSLDAPYIVLGGSARWRYQPRREASTVADYVDLARALATRARVVVMAIEHQEEPYLRTVAEEAGCAFVGSTIPVAQALDLLAYSTLYVGGRWHTALKAAIGGTPFVMLATNSSYKTSGLLRLYELDQPEIDFYDIAPMRQTILATADALLAGGETERARIRAISKAMALSAPDNVHFLRP